MFGFGKKKKCKCDEDSTPKIEIHEIIVEEDNHDDVLCEMLSSVLTPYLNKICNKLSEEGKKGEKEQDIAFNKFKELLEMEEDFDPWHIAALILQNKVVNEGKKSSKKNNVSKKTKKKVIKVSKSTSRSPKNK